MSLKRVTKRPLPKSNKGWLKEIADAYIDALGVNAFAQITETIVGNEDLFHLAPAVCVGITSGSHRSD